MKKFSEEVIEFSQYLKDCVEEGYDEGYTDLGTFLSACLDVWQEMTKE